MTEIYSERLDELNNSNKCFTCGSEIKYIKNPIRAGIVFSTCSNRSCSIYVWPAGWPEVQKPKYYETGKAGHRGEGGGRPRKASARTLNTAYGKIKKIGHYDNEETTAN